MTSTDLASRYSRVAALIQGDIKSWMPLLDRMKIVSDRLWEEFGNGRPVSWVGFYFLAGQEMTLGPRRDKPACSPIGLHGACGTAATCGNTLIVRDVKELGEFYIACDPRDQSEIVVPVRGKDGKVIAVLDVDSHDVGAFGEIDEKELEAIVEANLSL